ncbi:MAG TPA: hypothetical protein VJT71_13715 [Pyrinomonadaceae bacterium]|nr:hypothetical protein [Pyrinomonadaceae bacterium]
MSYDNAGNLTTDTYSGSAVTRAYDAENRMTSELQANNYQAGTYSYDGDGRRIKRVVGGTETLQVYGLGGELLAEYSANAAASCPQKEYGYRNGEMLITAEASAGGGTRANVALATNGATATAQNYTADVNGSHFRPADTIDGIRYAVTAPPPGDINDFWREGQACNLCDSQPSLNQDRRVSIGHRNNCSLTRVSFARGCRTSFRP